MDKLFGKYFWLFVVLFFLSAASLQSQIPDFNEKRAFEYLQKQCRFGPRNPGSSGHRECLEFLVMELRKTADAVITQPFPMTDPHDNRIYTGTNIIAYFGSRTDCIILCAHWDTRARADRDPDPKNHNIPIQGANDGASGVAVLLEVAQVLNQNPPSRGVTIVLFDGEDAGIEGQDMTWCQGSRYFAKNKKPGYNPSYGILVDLVGDKDLYLPYELYSMRYAPDLVRRVWETAINLGLPAFDNSPGYHVVDDHQELFKVGIPCINIIDFDYPHWHTIQDTEDKCSPESLGVVGSLLVYLIYE